MMPRWYHSRLFWIGLVWLFLPLWMWLGLGGYIAEAGWFDKSRNRYYGLMCEEGTYVISHSRLETKVGIEYPETGFHLEKVEPEKASVGYQAGSRYFQPFAIRFFNTRDHHEHIHSLVVSGWFLPVIYLGCWAGSLFFWHRRKVRLISPPPNGAAGGIQAH